MPDIVIPDDKAGTVYITPKMHNKLKHYVRACKTEVHGYGNFGLDEDNDLIIKELFPIPEQIASGAEVETSEAAMYEMIKSPYSRRCNFQWHSHVDFAAFWSHQDELCISQLLQTRITSLLSIVMNKKGEYKCRLDVKAPMHIQVPMHTRFIMPSIGLKDMEKIEKELDAKLLSRAEYALKHAVEHRGSEDADIIDLGEDGTGRALAIFQARERASRNGRVAYATMGSYRSGSRTGLSFDEEGSHFEEISPSMSESGWCIVDGTVSRIKDSKWLSGEFNKLRQKELGNGRSEHTPASGNNGQEDIPF